MIYQPFRSHYICGATRDSDSFKEIGRNRVHIPIDGHVGAFGVERKYDYHTGVDLYVPDETLVFPMENGIIVNIEKFTGKDAGSPYWNNTHAVLIKGKHGVFLYGEIEPDDDLYIGKRIANDSLPCSIGKVKRVLKKDKGRPMSMLHIELYEEHVRKSSLWFSDKNKPEGLLNPTNILLELIEE